MLIADIILNLAIAVITLAILFRFSRRDGEWQKDHLRVAFRFFTCQSNVLCAAAALLTAIAAMTGTVPRWIWTLKYIGTVAVTITMVTVFVYLAPLVGKDWVKRLLGGADLYMHLVTPLLAILSFCLLEKRGMSFPWSLWGMVPVAVYGPHYLYRILYAPEGKSWDDFYRFNQHGKWKAAYAAMFTASLVLCVIFWALQNL